ADAFLVGFELRDNPNLSQGPYLRMIVDAPNLAIIQHAYRPHITKITDQDGKDLPLSATGGATDELSNVGAQTHQVIVSAGFDKIPDFGKIKVLKEFQATLELGILDKEAVY